MQKKLHKSDDRKIFGVCGGFAEYFNMDPTLMRILWVIFAFVYGSGLLIYFICALVMPNN
jgi:phage shock protein C